MGAVQHCAFFSIQGDKTVENTVLRKINLPGHSGHLDNKNDALNTIFRDLIYLIWMI